MSFYSPIRNLKISSINSAFIRDAYEDFYFDGEMHDFWEMVYCRDGCVTVSENDRTYELSKNQIIFHKPMEFHRLWAKKGQAATLIIVSFSCEQDGLISNLGNGIFQLDKYMSQKLIETFEQITAAFNCEGLPVTKASDDDFQETIALLNTELLLLNIVSEITPTKAQTTTIGAQHYKKILDVMNNNINENLTVDDIASLCFLSTSNLKRIFKTYAGCGVKEYYNRLRIIQSCKLLRKGVSVSDISNLMSFSSPNYFTTVFKREIGLSPRDYIHNENYKTVFVF